MNIDELAEDNDLIKSMAATAYMLRNLKTKIGLPLRILQFADQLEVGVEDALKAKLSEYGAENHDQHSSLALDIAILGIEDALPLGITIERQSFDFAV